MAVRRLSQIVKDLRLSWWAFFQKRCLVGFPWYWPSRPPGLPAMVEARRLVRKHFGVDHHPALRILARVPTALVWIPASFVHLLRIRYHRGQEMVPTRRMPGAIWAAIRHNILPGEYFGYQLWQPGRRENIDNYLYSNEASRLFKFLNQPMRSDPINDKLALKDMCKAHALPTPHVLAVFTPGGPLFDFECHLPPKHDLFVKSRFGISGRSAERLRWEGSCFVSNRGPRVAPNEVSAYLTMQACKQKRSLLVQPAYTNHPSLKVERDGALAAVRLVTGRSTAGVIVPLFGFIYFPRSDEIISQHGYVTLIDVANGHLMSPDWSATKGTVPNWDLALKHATAAHKVCSSLIFIGWDIAFTEQGPMLLEGNANWSADEFQSISGTPLGLTKFSDILTEIIEEMK